MRSNTYGSQFKTGGYDTWPRHKSIPGHLEQKAAEILAFDALIQNPDRRPDNPNLLWKDDEIFVYDHELAFSFIRSLGQRKDGWMQEAFSDCVRGHVFYGQLKGKELQLNRFIGAFEALTSSHIQQLTSAVPREWKSDKTEKITKHLLTVREKLGNFIEGVRRAIT